MKNPHAFRVYLTLSAASTFFNAVMFTVLTVYYVTVAGLNPLQLVLVGTVMEIATLLFEIPTGIVADLYSRRLSVIIGTFVTGAALVMVGFSSTFFMIACSLAVYGIGSTFLSGAREAWIVDEVGEEHASYVFLRTTRIRRIAQLFGTFVSVGLASIALSLPILLGGSLTVVLGVYLIFVMPETGFQPSVTAARSSWRAMRTGMADGVQLIQRRPLLRWFLMVAIVFGAYAEAFDRLGEAHFLINFDFPALGNFDQVVWFGIIRAGAQLLGFFGAGMASQRLQLDEIGSTVRILSILQLCWIGGVIAFGLAGNFYTALLAYWSIGAIQTVHQPIYSGWLNQH
ncbi:MAG: MFS transporter, partial [Caldilineaceae bacterium]|nr:MFS transporter [Caldilineaceae bacterium]